MNTTPAIVLLAIIVVELFFLINKVGLVASNQFAIEENHKYGYSIPDNARNIVLWFHNPYKSEGFVAIKIDSVDNLKNMKMYHSTPFITIQDEDKSYIVPVSDIHIKYEI